MKIVVSAYQEGVPREVRETYDPRECELDLVDMKFLKNLELEGTILREPDSLSFSGQLESRIVRICGRCLQESEEDLSLPFQFYYETKDKEVIDTIDDIREAVVVDQPMAYFCREDCLGLCPYCGGNRNEKPCRCSEKHEEKQEPKNPFQKLKQFGHRNKEE